MNARDHLCRLQQQYPLPRGHVTRVVAEMARARGDNPASVAQLLSAAPGPDPTGERFRLLLSVGPERLRQLHDSGNLAAGTIALSTIDAYKMEPERGSWMILVHLGFTQFLYRSARAVALVVPEPDSESDGWEGIEDVASILAEFMWWCRVAGQPYAPEHPAKPHQIEIALGLSDISDLFFLAHELGHVWCDVAGRDAVEKTLATPPSKKVMYREEHVADGFALQLLLDATSIKPGVVTDQAVYAGAEFGLQLLRLMEHAGIRFGGSHPSAESRLAYLRQLAAGFGAVRAIRRNPDQSLVLPTIGRLAGTTERIFDRALALIGEHAPTGESPAILPASNEMVERIMAQIEAELDLASEGARIDDALVTMFVQQISAFGEVRALVAAAARSAVRRADLLAAPELLAETHTDAEILREQVKQDLLLCTVRKLLPDQARPEFVALLADAITVLERE